jgi:hypothetical protein
MDWHGSSALTSLIVSFAGIAFPNLHIPNLSRSSSFEILLDNVPALEIELKITFWTLQDN